MRFLLTASLLACIALATRADDPKPAPIKKAAPPAAKDDETAKPKLGMGDAAPALKVTKWMKGDAVPSFEPNKVYVVEFWATWCGPCIQAMPHLCDLQEELRSKGLVVLGITSKAQNSEDEVVKFMESKKGKRLNYAMGFCEDDATDNAFMKAAGQNGIPCSFVIDKTGKVAYIGHPMSLDDVLPKVLDGTWKGKADMEAIEKVDNELMTIFRKVGTDAEGALKDLAAFEEKYPNRKASLADRKVFIYMQAKKFEDAKAISEKMLEKAIAKEDGAKATMICQIWSAKQLNPDKKNLDLAVKAGEAAVKLNGDDDLRTLLGLAEAYHMSGAKDKAIATAEKAAAAAKSEGPRAVEFVAGRLKEYRGEEKEDAKPKDKP